MRVRFSSYFSVVASLSSLTLISSPALARPQTPSTVQFGPPAGMDPAQVGDLAALQYGSANAEIYVKGPKGEPLKGSAVVTLFRVGGQFFNQGTAEGGLVKFDRMPFSEFTVQVIAPGYQTATKRFEISKAGAVTVTVDLQPLDAEDAAASVGFYALSPKVQKDVGKALQALHSNKPSSALSHLQAADKNAPNSAEIQYLFGVYASQTNDPFRAKSYWMKTLQLNPRHLSALIAVGQDLLHENKPADALPYLQRAVNVEPESWRAQALLSEACVLQGLNDEAAQHAQRAIDLGHERASSAELVLVRVLVQKKQVPEAISKLESYVKAHPEDKDTTNYLERLKNPPAAADASAAAGNLSVDAAGAGADALPVPSNWLPPDVDSSVPAVEPGATCSVDDVVKKAGQRLSDLVSDVDRFTATESLVHESINRYGMPSAPEKRRFNYVVAIEELQHKYLNVEEFRSVNGAPPDFPGGVATNGLPALVLIFHPFNAGDFAMTCEGLARVSGGLAWQVHFKQRPDKPNLIKRYRIGADGPSYPVALKGRAWISSDTYQIVRLETDMVAPLPEIKLRAEHTDIEYGPVKFRDGTVSMWLPQRADVYYDWRGRRIHRRHSFSNYLLFGVDERQKISVPKTEDTATNSGPNEQKEKP